MGLTGRGAGSGGPDAPHPLSFRWEHPILPAERTIHQGHLGGAGLQTKQTNGCFLALWCVPCARMRNGQLTAECLVPPSLFLGSFPC